MTFSASRPELFWNGPHSAAQQLEILDRQVAHRLVERPLVKGGERFGGEVFVVPVRSERQMEFASAAAQKPRGFQEVPTNVATSVEIFWSVSSMSGPPARGSIFASAGNVRTRSK